MISSLESGKVAGGRRGFLPLWAEEVINFKFYDFIIYLVLNL